MPMEYAITLPQGGRAANPESIKQTAVLAEELGYSHVWVNDHITFPAGQDHPSPYSFDPLMTLATAAAVTSTIGIGSQITAAYYSPLWLANALASLDKLSNGRLIIAIGVGWSKPEFEALGSNFADRGVRTNEIIEILRTAWEKDFVPIDTPHYHLPGVKILPKPAHRIPIWVAGHSEPGYRRAVERADGFHGEQGGDIQPENIADRVARIRRDRPEQSFTFSVYTWGWDLGERSEEDVLRDRDTYEAAGVQHVVISLRSRDAESRLQTVERLAKIFDLKPR
jgi:probable F420-dependent oxidoreductase